MSLEQEIPENGIQFLDKIIGNQLLRFNDRAASILDEMAATFAENRRNTESSPGHSIADALGEYKTPWRVQRKIDALRSVENDPETTTTIQSHHVKVEPMTPSAATSKNTIVINATASVVKMENPPTPLIKASTTIVKIETPSTPSVQEITPSIVKEQLYSPRSSMFSPIAKPMANQPSHESPTPVVKASAPPIVKMETPSTPLIKTTRSTPSIQEMSPPIAKIETPFTPSADQLAKYPSIIAIHEQLYSPRSSMFSPIAKPMANQPSHAEQLRMKVLGINHAKVGTGLRIKNENVVSNSATDNHDIKPPIELTDKQFGDKDQTVEIKKVEAGLKIKNENVESAPPSIEIISTSDNVVLTKMEQLHISACDKQDIKPPIELTDKQFGDKDQTVEVKKVEAVVKIEATPGRPSAKFGRFENERESTVEPSPSRYGRRRESVHQLIPCDRNEEEEEEWMRMELLARKAWQGRNNQKYWKNYFNFDYEEDIDALFEPDRNYVFRNKNKKEVFYNLHDELCYWKHIQFNGAPNTEEMELFDVSNQKIVELEQEYLRRKHERRTEKRMGPKSEEVKIEAMESDVRRMGGNYNKKLKDYGVDEIDEDMCDQEFVNTTKDIPAWADWKRVARHVKKQVENPPFDVKEFFGEIPKPNLKAIFGDDMKYRAPRGSSACWTKMIKEEEESDDSIIILS